MKMAHPEHLAYVCCICLVQLSDAASLFKKSFPLPMVTDPADTLCANNATIYAHICGPQEVAVYLKVSDQHLSSKHGQSVLSNATA